MGGMKARTALIAVVALMLAASLRLCAQTAHPAQPVVKTPQLVILDTDIGDDIDDAFALALALRSPELHLLGVTTEFGDTELRARLVDRYLQAVGRGEIPIEAGIKTPAPSHFTQAAYAQQQPDRPHGNAVDFLLAQIRKYPNQITLVSIGPLVNVQAAIARDPATFRKLKRVVLMGGSIYRGYDDGTTGAHRPPEPEWNVRCDPAGLRALLGVGVPVFMMPLDSTQIRLQKPALASISARQSPLTAQLTMLYQQWAGDRPSALPTLFDPVAVTYTFRPDLCPATPLRIEVDDKGFTRPVAGAPNAEVCLKSDEAGFLSLLLERILQ